MKSNRFVIVAATLALIVSALAFYRDLHLERLVLSERCRAQSEECSQNCETGYDLEILRILIRRDLERLEHSQRMIECSLDLSSAARCRGEEEARHSEAVARFDASTTETNTSRVTCLQACGEAAGQCQRDEDDSGFTPKPDVTVEFKCIDAPGAPCFQKVPDLCQRISGACDNCALTLCGDRIWTLEGDSLLDATLIAVAGSGAGRTLASSSSKGNRATLFIPRKIKLESGEELQVRLTFSGAQAKSRKLILHRVR